MLDLLIRDVQIADGTHRASYRGDVAIEGGSIADVGSLPGAIAKQEISGFPAQKLGLVDRGVIDKGRRADRDEG